MVNCPTHARLMGSHRNHGRQSGRCAVHLGLRPNASNLLFYLWVGDEDKQRKPSFDNFRSALTAVGNSPRWWLRQGWDTTIAGGFGFARGLVVTAHSAYAQTLLVCGGHTPAPWHLGDLHSKNVSRCVSASRTTRKVRMLDRRLHHSCPNVGREADRSESGTRRFEPGWKPQADHRR